MLRALVCAAAIAGSLSGIAAPAFAVPLELQPHEREAMLVTCSKLPTERTLCLQVVNDDRIGANDKRSCLHAMKSMLEGSTWSTVRGLPAAATCRAGLGRAGYPVQSISQRLATALH